MPSVSVLHISDAVVGPHLELLRNVCEPDSNSSPHITVRYFEKLSIPPEHLRTHVGHIDIISPGSFGVDDEWSQSNRTIYLRCESEELLTLEHKPYFPTSFFHITIYDGRSLEFARSLLAIMNGFSWRFRVALPKNSTLAKIELKPRRDRKKGRHRPYRAEVKSLFEEITSNRLTRVFAESLSDRQRLNFAQAICAHLHAAVSDFEKVRAVCGAAIQPDGEVASAVTEGEVHLTPPELAQAVAQYAVDLLPDNIKVHFGDPAVGTGAFFAALTKAIPRERIASAIGIDISAQQVAAARARWSHRGMEVKLGDYLHMRLQAPRTLILANPPYRRHQHIPMKDKQALRERASIDLGLQVSGRAGLYVYFLLLAHEWMAPDAVAAWLVPSEFMQTQYGVAVRYYLTRRVQLVRLHRFDQSVPQFENAKVLPAVVVFRNREPQPEDQVLMSAGGTLDSPVFYESTLIGDLRQEQRWSVPLPKESNSGSPECRIGDLFTVCRGIATGANKFFILKREEAIGRGIPASALRPLLPKARVLTKDVIERAADGFPELEPQLCMIDCALSEEEVGRRFPAFADYLSHAKKLGILDRNLVRHRRPWYRQEQRKPARFLCTYMGRGRGGMPPIRFLWNKSDAVVTNTYLMLYPHSALARRLAQTPLLEGELFKLLQEAASRTMQEVWRIHADGLVKIEPGELLQVPLIGIPTWIREILDLRL